MTTIESKKIGRVKWYNLDLRYGFITILDNKYVDIFVHKNNISSDLNINVYLKVNMLN